MPAPAARSTFPRGASRCGSSEPRLASSPPRSSKRSPTRKNATSPRFAERLTAAGTAGYENEIHFHFEGEDEMKCVRRGWMKGALCAAALALGAGPVAAADERQDRIERLEREIERLRDEVDSLQEERKEAPAPAAAGRVAASAGALADRVKIGGYGSRRFEDNSADETFDTFT